MSEFNKEKIVNAIYKAAMDSYVCGQNVEKIDRSDYDVDWQERCMVVADSVVDKLRQQPETEYTVENIQDLIEFELMKVDGRVAKSYILYRESRSQLRKTESVGNGFQFVTSELLSRYKHLPDPFPTELGKIVYYRTYSRPVESQNRRERWWETVARVVEYSSYLEREAIARKRAVTDHDIKRLQDEAVELFDAIFHLRVFPSGRTLWVGNTLSSKVHALGNFNCSMLAIDSYKKFSEIFSVLMLGTGVGLSVEKKYISKLPKVNTRIELIQKDIKRVPKYERKEFSELKQKSDNMMEIVVGDSKFGWTMALEMYFQIITQVQYAGIKFIVMNYDNVRPAGERLKTFGGYASGEQAVAKMFYKIGQLLNGKQSEGHWYKIKPLDALDIATIIAENVVSGGVRRSSEIVFCDPDEQEVIEAKSKLYFKDAKDAWQVNSDLIHRTLSNNTILYKERPTKEQLSAQFNAMRYSGEPGFGNMAEMLRRRPDAAGTNPCGEILLRDRGVCNLTEVNMMAFVRPDGSFDKEALIKAQQLSAKIGYRMATTELELHEWNLVNQEDMLTGCSITGVMDFVNATQMSWDDLSGLLAEMRQAAKSEVTRLAKFLGTNESKLVTTIKPSGTISQLPTVSSGVHFSHAPYYIRRVRVNANDPMAKALKRAGFIWHPENNQTIESHTTAVFEIPVKAPKGKTKYDVSAIEQLELYKLVMQHYVDHNASNTVHVRNDEWPLVEEWVYNNWDAVVGITFLSLDDSFYQLMPYEEISEEKYNELAATLPTFNPVMLREFESFVEEFDLGSDCEGGACPIR